MRTVSALMLCLTFLAGQQSVFGQADDPAGADATEVDGQQKPDPIVDSPLLREPETPREMLDAARLMTDLARYRLAKRYLELLLDTDPDRDTLLELRDRFGPAEFLRLSRVKELRPASSDLLQKINESLREAGGDTKRIDMLVAKLSAEPREREVALSTLKDTGVVAVPRIIAALGDPQSEEDQKLLVYSLAKMGPEIIAPLTAGLNSPNPELRISLAETLGWLEANKSIPDLLYLAYSGDEKDEVRRTALASIRKISKNQSIVQGSLGAASALRRQALAHMRGDLKWETDDEGMADVWFWDAEARTVVATKVRPETASLYTGTRLAAQAAKLSPDNAESQAVFLALSLGREADAVGWDKPLMTGPGTAHNLALSSGETATHRALQVALESHSSESARAALQVLGEMGMSKSNSKSLAGVLDYANPRVQFAAANAMMNRGETASSRRLVEVFGRTLSGGGSAHGVVIDPNSTRGQVLAVKLDGLGLEALVSLSGRDGFKQAAESSNVGLIVINSNCSDWGLTDTIANLRADARTAGIPIVIIGPDYAAAKLQATAARHMAMTYIDESILDEGFQRTVLPFSKRFNPVLTPRERQEQTTLSAYWLAKLAEQDDSARDSLGLAEASLYDAVDDARLASNALASLAHVPTNSAQTRLFDVLMTNTRPEETRELAGVHLAAHMQRYGVMLKDIQKYGLQKMGDDEELGSGLVTALAAVEGAMRPTRDAIQHRVESFVLPARP